MFLIIECQLFPCIDYIKNLIQHKHVKIEQYENFKKMSFRNRYIISGANGLQNLTIPIAGGREQKTLIQEVRIDNSIHWQTKHWRSLFSAYSKAPFFEYYEQDIKNLLFCGEEFLFSFNIKILNWLYSILKINSVVEFTTGFMTCYDDAADYRNYFLPKSFQKNSNNWLPQYAQVFEDRLGFQPNLSIIDLILCEGPNARNLLDHS